MRHVRPLVTVSVLAGVIVVAAAGPAAADHVAGVGADGCHIGAIATGGLTASTDRSTMQVRRDGTVRVICQYNGLPMEAYDPWTEMTWVRPTEPYTDDVICSLHDDELVPHPYELFGDGTARYTPGGSLKVTCEFDLAELPG